MWRSTVQKFSGGGSGFDPGFSETEKVRVVPLQMSRTINAYEATLYHSMGTLISSQQSTLTTALKKF